MRLAALLLLLAACAPAAPDRGVLAIGDSVMAWNRDGIPEVTAAALGLPLRDASRVGAGFAPRDGLLGLVARPIPEQWERNRGRWDWVLLTAGANDLRPLCGTPEGAAALDALVGPGGGGRLPALIDDIRRTGSRVAYVGYYDGSAFGETGFTACQGLFTELNARMARRAAADDGVAFLDAGTVIDPATRAHYAHDLVHPSALGSRLVGEALAGILR